MEYKRIHQNNWPNFSSNGIMRARKKCIRWVYFCSGNLTVKSFDSFDWKTHSNRNTNWKKYKNVTKKKTKQKMKK